MQTIHQKKYMSTAYSIGRQLARTAIIGHDGRFNWQGDVSDVIRGREQVFSMTFKSDIYLGLSGIAFFLAELYARIPDTIIGETLEGTVKNILQQHREQPFEKQFSFFSGQLGVGWTLFHIGTLLKRKDWQQSGLDIIQSLNDKVLQSEAIDIINGAAGAIPIFLRLYTQLKQPIYLELAERCGAFLLEKAVTEGEQSHWLNSFSNMGLTGYSHGAAGMTTALLELFHFTKNEDYQIIAMQSFAFEQEHFVDSQNNWKDLRLNSKDETTPICGKTWCHGAPGIALANIKSYHLTKNQSFLEAAQVGFDTTYQTVQQSLENVESANFSLCHGLSGNALILYFAGLTLNRSDYLEMATQIGNKGIELYEATKTYWPSGVSATKGTTKEIAYTPGFMLGDAGIGYFYLQMATGAQLPNLLLL